MSTPRQRKANRANAQLSTGPVSPRGRAAVRSNAFQHGFYARLETHFTQDPAAYQALLDDFLADYRPVGAAETELVHRIVRDLVKSRRFEAAETAYLSELVGGLDHTVHSKVTDPAARSALALQEGFADGFQSRAPAPIERFEMLVHRLRRAVDKSTQLLCQLQRERLASAALTEPHPLDGAATEGSGCVAEGVTEPQPEGAVVLQRHDREGVDVLLSPNPLPIDDGSTQLFPAGEDACRGTDARVCAGSPDPPLQIDPTESAAPPSSASKTESQENVTPPSPTKHEPNPEIGFVPHKMKSRTTPSPNRRSKKRR